MKKEFEAPKLTAKYKCPECKVDIELPFANPEGNRYEKLVRAVYLALDKNKEPCWRCAMAKKKEPKKVGRKKNGI